MDWNTLAESFWAWFGESQRCLAGEPCDDRVAHMIEAHRARVDQALEGADRPEDKRFVLATAIALLGALYASEEKLVAALDDRGVLEPRPKPSFDTLP
jgi:hypothetical protein